MSFRNLVEPRMRAPVLLIGAHRSGTTATARALDSLGLQLGHRLDSHREPKGLQRLHENYLERVGAAWHNPAPFLESLEDLRRERDCVEYLRANVRERFARVLGYRSNPRGLWRLARRKFGAPWGWKEPRTTLFAAAWLEVFPEARIVHMVRDPRAAAMSIRQRELAFRAHGDPPTPGLDDVDHCLHLVRTYVEVGERVSRRTPRYGASNSKTFRRIRRRRCKSLATFATYVLPARA